MKDIKDTCFKNLEPNSSGTAEGLGCRNSLLVVNSAGGRKKLA
jgi:hypothetical protein